MKIYRRSATMMLIAFCFTSTSWALERGTKEEAKAMADAAFEHMTKVGAAKALKDFTEDSANWTKKDLYVFAYDGTGVCTASGGFKKLVGKNLLDFKDASGKPFIQEMLAAAKGNTSAWVEFDWQHTETKKIEHKAAYLRKLPVGEGFLAVGFYR